MKKTLSFIICMVLLLSLASCNRKKEVEYSYFVGNFNPFSVATHTDLAATALTQAYLVVKQPSRTEDTEAEIIYDAYSRGVGIADIEVERNSEQNYALYTIKIGKDVKFSNGDPVTAKDAAFSLYTYCDMDYVGWAKADTAYIDGLDEYRYNNSAVGDVVITDAQIEAELDNPSELTAKYIRENIIVPVLEEEYRWVTHIYTDDAYKSNEIQLVIQQNPALEQPHNLFAYFYAKKDSGYVPVKDKDQLISDIADQYGTDYEALSVIYSTDLTELARECAKRALTEKALEGMDGTPVARIRGINIVDDKTLTVKINSLTTAQLENALGVFVAPFSVYGKNCEYKDGAFDIDIDSVLDSSLEPIGAGPCVFEGYKKDVGVSLSENKNYFKEADFECNVLLKETGSSEVKPSSPYFVTFDERLIVSD